MDANEIIRFTDNDDNDVTGDAFVSDERFNEMVPHLQALLGGDLEVTVNPHTGKLAAYAEYPAGGRLKVAKVFDYEALHVGKHHTRGGCVARLTLVTIDTDELKVWVNHVPVTIGDDSTVLIANVPKWSPEFDHLKRHCESLRPMEHALDSDIVHANHGATDHFNLFGKIVKGDINCTVVQTGACHLKLDPVEPLWVEAIASGLGTFAGTNIGCGNTNWP